MKDFKKNLIHIESNTRDALAKINDISERFPLEPLALFVIGEDNKLLGTLTDGDIRRGLLNGKSIEDPISQLMNPEFHFLQENAYGLDELEVFLAKNIKLVPILDKRNTIVEVFDFTNKKSLLPVDAVIMAGGRGSRLKPFTDDIPKPLLEIGNKPIIEYNIDLLRQYGVGNLVISINYLGDQLKEYFGDGSSAGMNIRYVREKKPLGTMGSLSLVDKFSSDHILMMNSDLLTTIDLHSFYKDFIAKNADMAVASIPYEIKVPYAVFDINGEHIKSFKEKPEYTYHSNGGIYLLKTELAEQIPENEYLDATDFIESLIDQGKKVSYFPILGYWQDIGRPEDFEKAKKDIKILDL